MPGKRLLRVVDALWYALGVALLSLVAALVLTFPLGAGWPAVKLWLFVFGMGAFGLSALELRPTPRWREEPRFSIEPDADTPFQSAVQRVPPLRGNPLAPDERFSTGARLFFGSLLTLATSFLMEAVLGVGVPTA